MWGIAVGLFAVAAVVASFRAAAAARVASVVALLAICLQGYLGGQRVELVSRELAFVHGGIAQGVFALLVLHVLLQSRRWRQLAPARAELALPAAATWLAMLLVYAQIWVGAWYRHGLRGSGLDVAPRLHLHLGLALLVTLALVWLARAYRRAADAARGASDTAAANCLDVERKRLHALLGAQLLLGFLAWGARGDQGVTVLEVAAATGHVLVGASLLASLVVSLARLRRLHPSHAAAPLAAAVD
jgi:cytochrome c oxidase assembly protein subunit 15